VSAPKTRLVTLGLLLIFFAQLLQAARSLSTTVDEGFHITSGYEYLRTGRVQLFDEHPPLAKALFAWPLKFVPDLPPPEETPGYTEGDLITVAQATVLAYQPIDRLVVACRIPVALLCVLLACSVYRWTVSISGKAGALLALAFFTFDPNVLAHGSLATTDLGSTAFIFWTLFALYIYLQAPGKVRWWLVAVMLGLAQLTKLTAIMLFPVGGIVIVLYAVLHAPDHRGRALLRAVISYAGMIGIAAVVVWAGYGFEIRPISTIANGTLPLPAASHIERWERLRANLAYGRESYLLGQNRMYGWWQYFPIAFLIKTPLPTLILAVWAILRFTLKRWNVGTLKRLTSHASRITSHTLYQIMNMVCLLLFPLLYAASSLTSTINIGYRHLLPILPFLYVGVGSREYGVRSKKCKLRVTSDELGIKNQELPILNPQSPLTPYSLRLTPYFLLLAWLVVGTLTLSPNYLTFFNEIAGGPQNGWRFLADSNTDWGQTLKALAAYQQKNETGPVQLSLFTFLDPATYGVDYVPIAPMTGVEVILPQRFNPKPGLYAISATTLDGVPLVNPEMYDWFRWNIPDTRIANALHYYHVTTDEVAITWIAQCQTPVAPLNDAAIAEGFGITAVRRVDFDCTKSWIIPSNNAITGRYILHGALLQDTLKSRLHYAAPPAIDPFVARRLTALTIVYRQRMYRTEPAFAIYAPAADTVIPSSNAWIARADTLSTMLTTRAPIAHPITLDGPLTFLGAAAYQQQNVLDVETWWIVTDVPPTRPLSIMGHLLNKAGEIKGIADGLGIPALAWQTGDVLVQRHVFPLAAGETHASYLLRTGVYWADDGTRWRITTDMEADAIFVAVIPTITP